MKTRGLNRRRRDNVSSRKRQRGGFEDGLDGESIFTEKSIFKPPIYHKFLDYDTGRYNEPGKKI